MIHLEKKKLKQKILLKVAEQVSGKSLESFILQWLNRDDIPNPKIKTEVIEAGNSWKLNLNIKQDSNPYHFFTSIEIETENDKRVEIIEVNGNSSNHTFELDKKPIKVTFNVNNDILLHNDNYFTWSNFFDDFSNSIIVYGTKRQIEANHTLALRFSKMLADKFTETLVPVKKDSELSEDDIKNKDLLIIGNISDNNLMELLANKLDLDLSKNSFSFYW